MVYTCDSNEQRYNKLVRLLNFASMSDPHYNDYRCVVKFTFCSYSGTCGVPHLRDNVETGFKLAYSLPPPSPNTQHAHTHTELRYPTLNIRDWRHVPHILREQTGIFLVRLLPFCLTCKLTMQTHLMITSTRPCQNLTNGKLG